MRVSPFEKEKSNVRRKEQHNPENRSLLPRVPQERMPLPGKQLRVRLPEARDRTVGRSGRARRKRGGCDPVIP